MDQAAEHHKSHSMYVGGQHGAEYRVDAAVHKRIKAGGPGVSFEVTQATLRLDWERTGWARFFPAEGEALWGLLCDATEGDVDGDLDSLIDWQHTITYPILGLESLHDLDAPIAPGPYRVGERLLERMCARWGVRFPATVRDVARLGVRLGLYRRHMQRGRQRWRVPPGLPLPTEVLPMSARQARREDARRWHLLGACPGIKIVELLLDDGQPRQAHTTVGTLASRLRTDPDTVRHGLTYLCDWRFCGRFTRSDMWAYGHDAGRLRVVDPQRLRADDECVLMPNWRKLWRQHGLLWELQGHG